MDRAWMVVISSMMLLFMTLGFVYSFGELYDPVIVEFNTTKSFVASVGALQQSLTFFIAPVGSLMLEKIGHRPTAFIGLIMGITGLIASSFINCLHLMYVTFALFGTGAGLIVTACINIVGVYFKTGNSSRAFAVVSAGIPTGTFVINLLEYYIYDKYGWRKSLLIIAGMYVVIATISLIFFTAPAGEVKRKRSSTKVDIMKYFRIFGHLKFVLYELGVILLAFSISFHYIDFISVIDVQSNGSGTVAVSILSFSDLIALILLAFLGNSLPKIRRHILPLVLLTLNLPSTILFAFNINMYTTYIASALSGFARGILLAAPFSLALQIFGAERGNECLTHTIMSIGIGSLIGPIALSFISVQFSSRLEFLTCGFTSAVGSILFFIESCLTIEKQEPAEDEHSLLPKKTNYGAVHA